MPALPPLALSVRQPWAWAIIHAGKDVENRSAAAIRHMWPRFEMPVVGSQHPTRIAIHAAKGMTRDEYERASMLIDWMGLKCPAPHLLLRGGIIGSVEVIGIVNPKDGDASQWWTGDWGLKLRHPEPCTFRPVVGALGLFQWTDASPDVVPPAAKWMLPRAADPPRSGAVGAQDEEPVAPALTPERALLL